MQVDSAAIRLAAIVDQHGEQRGFPGKDRVCPARRDFEQDQIAKGMQQRDQSETGQQEDQCIAEAEVVVDGADQHEPERSGEGQPRARGQDEYPPLRQDDRSLLRAVEAEQPALE